MLENTGIYDVACKSQSERKERPREGKGTHVFFLYEEKCNTVEDRNIYIRHTCLANYGASEAVNLCSRYVEKSTKCSE